MLYSAISLVQNLHRHLTQTKKTNRRKWKPKYSLSKTSLQKWEWIKQFVSYNYQYLTQIKKKILQSSQSTQLKQNISGPRCILALFEAKDKKKNTNLMQATITDQFQIFQK